MKNQGFCMMTKPEEVRNRSLLMISEDCEPTKMMTSGKRTVSQRSLTVKTFATINKWGPDEAA
jgi:hypothetical protein